MNAARMKRRLEKLEQRSYTQYDRVTTLEELCRSMWLSDKKQFLELARQTHLSHFVAQFQYDDAERRRTKRVELYDLDNVR
jgi:hypothetical protein